MTHPYFVDKARARLAEAGGDPDNAGPLAAWAEEAKRINDARRGVIVAEDGELIAGTRYHPSTPSQPGASYVDREDSARYHLSGNETGLAVAQLSRITGKRLIHVTMPEVCRGAGKFVPTVGAPPKDLDAVTRAVAKSKAAEKSARHVVAAAYTAGANVTQIAIAGDVTRQTVYRWLKIEGFRFGKAGSDE